MPVSVWESLDQTRKQNKLNSIYHGPYKVLHTSDHSMYIEKNGKVKKVSIRNVKAYVPRVDPEDVDSEESQENR